MEGEYRFLTEHSYSMVDYDTLSLKQRAMKTKKSRATSIRPNKTQSANRTLSVDRSSSDKENNSSTATNVPIPAKNRTKSPTKKKNSNSRKKQDTKNSSKNSIKPTQSTIMKHKNKKIKTAISHSIDIGDAPPSLSIEERVKLRRTTPFVTPIVPVLNTKPKSEMKSPITKSRKPMRVSKPNKNHIKSKKFFLGSGLDLDNIVLGNRERRSVKA